MSKIFYGFLLLQIGCASLFESDKKIPEITEAMSNKEVLDIGITYGGESFEKAKKMLVKRHAIDDAREITTQMILNDQYQKEALWRVVSLYQSTILKFLSPKIVEKLISSDEIYERQLGWILAANKPSDIVAATIDRFLSKSILENDEIKITLPEMAIAAKENKLTKVYSLLANLLKNKGDSEYAEAMIALDPDKSRYDLMDYLAQAAVEDLRQMNQKSIDMHTGLIILRFLAETGLPIEHPKFEHIFLFAVSRNPAFSELAGVIIEKSVTKSRDHLAYMLARLPVWIQLAYIEGTKDQMNANLGLFLSELKQVTAHQEVVDEIDSIKR